MTKDQIISIVRTLLTGIGAFFIGKSIFGVQVSDNILQLVAGSIAVIGSFVWSIVDKSLAVEGFQAAIKQVVTAIGGVLAALGKNTQSFESITGALLPVLTLIYTFLSQKKSIAIANGSIAIQDLKGVKASNAITPSLRVANEPVKTVSAIETKTVTAATSETPINQVPGTNTPVK
jgi:hypothetical protein